MQSIITTNVTKQTSNAELKPKLGNRYLETRTRGDAKQMKTQTINRRGKRGNEDRTGNTADTN